MKKDLDETKIIKEIQRSPIRFIGIRGTRKEEVIEELDIKKEIDQQLNLLSELMPEERNFIQYKKKQDKKYYDLIIQRFDPTKINTNQLQKNNIFQSNKNNKKKSKKLRTQYKRVKYLKSQSKIRQSTRKSLNKSYTKQECFFFEISYFYSLCYNKSISMVIYFFF